MMLTSRTAVIRSRAALFSLLLLAIAGGPLSAQDASPRGRNPEGWRADPAADDPPVRRGRRGRGGPPPAPETEKPEPKEKESDKPADRWLAIVGGTIHTVSDGVIAYGTILTKNGRIHEVGIGIPLPPDAQVLAVDGLHVYPGLVAIDSSGLASSPEDTDVHSFTMLLALAGGITTARAGDDIVKLTYGTLEGHALAKSPFLRVNYSSRNWSQHQSFREALARVREYQRAKVRWVEEKKDDPELKELDRKWIKGAYQTAERLLTGQVTALINASSAQEIRDICELAVRYQFKLVVNGAEEGWIAAGELARADAMAIITPRARRDPDERRIAPNGGSIENAAILYQHGVPMAIFPIGSLFAPGGGVSLSGLAGRDMLNLPLEAAFAVRGGLPDDAAVRAITIDAARLLGVHDRVGSIEVGKDADFVILDGELLHYLSLPQYTVVNGRIAYDQEKERILDHIRPGGDPEPTAAPEYWPRRLGEPF